MSQYIPDMTERFPEGLDGVDMTSRYFPERYSDPWLLFELDERMDMEDDIPEELLQ